VDARGGGKIIEFLRENSHLDLEVPDIAFNVKKSERTVEAALKKFQQKGLVTARQNEYGRVYWYALPSAPATKTFRVEELTSQKKERKKSSGDDLEDEVDLSELTGKSTDAKVEVKNEEPPVAAGKAKKAAAKKPAARKKTGRAKKAVKKEPVPKVSETTPPEKAADSGLSEEKSEMEIYNMAKPEKPVPAPDDLGEEVDLEALSGKKPEPQAPPPAAEDDDEVPVAKTPSISAMSSILVALFAVGLLSVGGLLKSNGFKGRIMALETAMPKDVVANKDFQVLEDRVAKVEEMENRMAAMATEIDSLKTKVDSLVVASKASKKKPVVRRRRRKR
jgi:hypothetical protein